MMITSYLGMEKFQKGLQDYLEKHKYGNAKTADLWAALTAASGKDVSEFMGMWTKEIGYPVVTLKREGGKAVFEQSRFLSNGNKLESGSWWVPMTITSADGSKIDIDVKEKSMTSELPGPMGSGWIKGNAAQTAFYRIRYSDELLAELGSGIESMKLPAVDRLGVQSDCFALAKAGFLPTDKALGIAAKYPKEQDFTVWSDLAASMSDVMGTWAKEPVYEQLQGFMRKLMKDIYEVVGWEAKSGEHSLFPMLRPLVIGALGRNGDAAVAAEAKKRFEGGWKTVPADLRFAVFSIVVANGGNAEFDAVHKIYEEAEMQEEKIRVLRGLGYCKDPELIDRFLGMSIDGSVRPQDVFYIFGTLAGNRFAMDKNWQFLKSNWTKILEMFAGGQFLLSRIIKSTAGAFASEEMAKDVEAFFKENQPPGADRAVAQALETIRSSANWVNRDREAVKGWLEANA